MKRLGITLGIISLALLSQTFAATAVDFDSVLNALNAVQRSLPAELVKDVNEEQPNHDDLTQRTIAGADNLFDDALNRIDGLKQAMLLKEEELKLTIQELEDMPTDIALSPVDEDLSRESDTSADLTSFFDQASESLRGVGNLMVMKMQEEQAQFAVLPEEGLDELHAAPFEDIDKLFRDVDLALQDMSSKVQLTLEAHDAASELDLLEFTPPKTTDIYLNPEAADLPRVELKTAQDVLKVLSEQNTFLQTRIQALEDAMKNTSSASKTPLSTNVSDVWSVFLGQLLTADPTLYNSFLLDIKNMLQNYDEQYRSKNIVQ